MLNERWALWRVVKWLRQIFSGNEAIESLQIESADGLVLKGGDDDHLYIQFFADSAAQTTRSGYMGFSSAGSETFQFVLDGYSGGSFSFNKGVTISGGNLAITPTGLAQVQVGNAGDTTEKRYRLVNAGASSGVDFVLEANGDSYGFYNRTTPRWDLDIDISQNCANFGGCISLVDGMTAPGTVSGRTFIYVDTSDGDLKVKFGDGTVKPIANDDSQGGMTVFDAVTVADDATSTFTSPTARPHGIWIVTNTWDDSAYGMFAHTSQSVTQLAGGTNFQLGDGGTNPDVDGDINCWMSGTTELSIKNRTGGNASIVVYHLGA